MSATTDKTESSPTARATPSLNFLVTALGPLQRIFGTASLTSRQWGICLLRPIALLGLLELGKFIDRRTSQRREPVTV